MSATTVRIHQPSVWNISNATVQEFETQLKEIVGAKRLSASKMQKLTELAMANMQVRACHLLDLLILF